MQDNEPLMRALSNLITVNDPDLVLLVGEALVSLLRQCCRSRMLVLLLASQESSCAVGASCTAADTR